MIFAKSQLAKTSIAEIGGKAFGLVDIRRKGFAVPEFVVVGAQTLWKKMDASHWEKIVSQLLQREITVTEAAEQMRVHIAALDLRDLLGGLRAFIGSPEASYAVRSSVVDEDGTHFSFAGQMDSYLFQRTEEEILNSIRQVWMSAFAERALEYRLLNRLPLQNIRAAVIVQEMLDADNAGVMFTADPTTGDRNRSLISAGHGVGEGVVAGTVDCDEYAISYSGAQPLITKTLIENEAPILSEAVILGLGQMGRRLADLKQMPLDIEWATKGNEIYFLQARAVTSETLRKRTDNQVRVFDNSNIQESFCGITLPLTFSFANQAYESVYSQLMAVMGFSEAQIKEHQIRHRNMLSYVDGRVYYNIQSWYDGLRFLPSFGKNKSDMERMMGVEHPVDFVEDLTLSRAEKLKRLPQMLMIVARLGWKFARIEKLVADFDQWFEMRYRAFDRQSLYRMNSQQLLDLARKTKDQVLENWAVPIINDFYVMMSNGKVFRALQSIGLEKEQPALLFGEKLESTEPTKWILKISDRIAAHSVAREALAGSRSGKEMMIRFQADCPEIYHLCEEFIERYGDRVIGELKLESISMRQDPEFLFQMLVNSKGRDLHSLEAKEQALRKNAEELVFGAMRARQGARAASKLKKQIKQLRQGIVFREKMRMSRTRVFGFFRSIYCEIGNQWQQMGLLENARDIFYLTEAEIEEKIESRSPHQNLKALVQLRKEEFAQYELHEPPGHFSVRAPWIHSSEFQVPKAKTDTDGMMKGLGCFPGLVRGEARVVLSAQEKLDLSGKILVTMRTDPGWAPLFVNIAGLIVERGSTLSHSAVVARELGIPTIVGISEVTKKIKSGDQVEFDGSEGWMRHVDENNLRPSL